MFPYEDSEILSVRTPRKKNDPGFDNISPTVVANWFTIEKVFTSTTVWKPNFFYYYFFFYFKIEFWIKKKNSKLNFDLCWSAENTLASSISTAFVFPANCPPLAGNAVTWHFLQRRTQSSTGRYRRAAICWHPKPQSMPFRTQRRKSTTVCLWCTALGALLVRYLLLYLWAYVVTEDY